MNVERSESSPAGRDSSSARAVFLSYASQDAEAARKICDALRASGVEVWFDLNELQGGDAWDAKIRRQIGACALFVPMISANTQARPEGYFRREWKLAVERTQDVADHVAFLLPVVLDDTKDRESHVPEAFLKVQWSRLPGGETTAVFAERVKKLLAGEGTHNGSRSAFVAGSPPNEMPTRSARPKRASRWAWAAGIAIAAGLATAVVLSRKSETAVEAATKSADAKPPAPAKLDPKAIAVLPFANLSGDPAQEYFSDGLTEEILDKLARIRALRVMSRTSAFFYKGKNVSLEQIARELRVGTIIEGSVRREGNQLRITAQLIDATTGEHVWTETYNRELKSVFAIQDEIAQEIAAKLVPAGISAVPTITATPTQNLAAHDAYLRGLSFQRRGNSFRRDAIREYERAVSLDPTFALAWAGLGRVLGLNSSATEADARAALHAIEEARRLGGDFFEVHMAAAHLHFSQLRYDFAEKELEQGDRLRPDDAEALTLRGRMEVLQGHWDEGIRLSRRAVERDPQNGRSAGELGAMLRTVGRYAEAEKALDHAFSLSGAELDLNLKALTYFQWKGDAALVVKALDSIPVSIRADEYWYYRWQLLRDLGDFAGALAAVDHAQADVIGILFQSKALLRALALESLGDREGARRAYQEALPTAERLGADNPHNSRVHAALARVYAGLDRKDEAFAALREAFKQANSIPFFMNLVNAVLAQTEARFGMIDEALALAKTQIATGWWKRNELLLGADWAELRKDSRFRELAEKASL